MHTGAALVASLCVMLMSLVGVVFAAGHLGAWMKKYLTYLATFSSGVFLLIAFHLASEAIEEGGWIVGMAGIILGALLMEAIHRLIPMKHHHHGHEDGHAHSNIDGRRVMLSDSLHNIGDGILLVGAFASSMYIGIAATVGVLLHEAVQEISEYFVLREAGYSNSGALIRNFAVSATILIGFFAAVYLSSIGFFLALLSGIAAGGFLSVVIGDLLPHALASVKTKGGALLHISAALLGGVTMFGLQSALPHEELEMEVSETLPAQMLQIPMMAAPMTAPTKTTKTSGNSNAGAPASGSRPTTTTATSTIVETPAETPVETTPAEEPSSTGDGTGTPQ